MGITILTATFQIDRMKAWLQLSRTKAEDTAVSETCGCNIKTSLDMSFSYMNEKKWSVLVTCCKKELAKHILEMRTPGDTPYRRFHILELSVRPGGWLFTGIKKRLCNTLEM